jgi:hypothetical protein
MDIVIESPVAGLPHRPCERAGCTRKPTLAEGVGCANRCALRGPGQRHCADCRRLRKHSERHFRDRAREDDARPRRACATTQGGRGITHDCQNEASSARSLRNCDGRLTSTPAGSFAQIAAIPRGLAKRVEGSQPPYGHWFGVIWRGASA